ncbi:methyltransferase domain-containing protein [Sphingomonas sp. RT2P30]|uniref:class I SAM-dependent methyltransferase n=1 Tax=Parasphingomonas halimpatiens TaxID=3096162 RepID=UPI002FCA33C7
MSASTPTSDELKAEDWAGAMGAKWLANIDRFESMIAPVGEAFLERAAFRPGERVIDIGCGGGGTSIAIGAQVASDGSVLGLDISPDLVAFATARARAAGAGNVSFVQADASAATPPGAPFDRLFSRFGSMFFAEPGQAFGNLKSLIRPGGRADLAVWAPARDNLWIAAMMGVLGRHLTLPAPVPRAPGPFALDDPDYIRALLGGAGFVDVDIAAWDGMQQVGGAGSSPESAVAFVLEALSFGELLAEVAPAVRSAVSAELIALFGQHVGPDGVAMPARAWFVSARA